MGSWLTSGRRRDLCALLYGRSDVQRQTLKADLEAHYDVRIDPASFQQALDHLVDIGYVDRTVDGITPVYALTPQGQQAAEKHYRWLTEQLQSDESGVSTDS